jgi:hypothetical protein
MKLTIPDTIKPFLKSSKVKGVFDVKNPADWLNRRFAKLGPLRVTLGSGETKIQFSSKILGIHKAKNNLTLIVDNFVPPPPAELFTKPRQVTAHLVYVEWGYEVSTIFKALVLRKVTVKGNPAVQLGKIEDVRVSLGVHVSSLAKTSNVELGLFVRGQFVEGVATKISLNKIWFRAPLPDDFRDEGLTIDKASLKLGEAGETLMFSLQAFPERGGGYEGRVLSMEHISKLANFIEQRWTNQASRLAAGQQKSDLGGGRSGTVDASKRKVDDYLKPHYFLLGDDQEWVERLNKFGICVPVPEKDTDQVLAKLDEKRCDVIIGDADYWDTDALVLAQLLRSHEKFSQVPLLWIASQENIFAENNGQDLIDLGAFDFLDRTTAEDVLKRKFFWASSKSELIGDGPVLAVVSQDNRQQYRLGMALEMKGISIVKVNTHETGILAKLLEYDVRWVLIDTVEFDGDVEKMIRGVSEWANRGDDPKTVFLLEVGMSEDEKKLWTAQGVRAVIPYDPSMSEIRKVIHDNINADLAKAASKEEGGEQPPGKPGDAEPPTSGDG